MLDELVEMGHTGTELGDWGYMPTDPLRLSEELARRNNIVMLGAYFTGRGPCCSGRLWAGFAG
jgi:inosose dehydratase